MVYSHVISSLSVTSFLTGTVNSATEHTWTLSTSKLYWSGQVDSYCTLKKKKILIKKNGQFAVYSVVPAQYPGVCLDNLPIYILLNLVVEQSSGAVYLVVQLLHPCCSTTQCTLLWCSTLLAWKGDPRAPWAPYILQLTLLCTFLGFRKLFMHLM